MGVEGQLGKLVVESLEKVPAEQIVAVVRDTQKAQAFAARGVQMRQADYSQPESLLAAFTGAEKVLLVSSREVGHRVPQHQAVTHAARVAGVTLLAYTSILNADTSTLLLAKEHQPTEANIRASGVPFTFLRNGWYTENHTGALAAAVVLCGWCYAVAPLVKAARKVVSIELHGGGMMTGARRQKITPAWREYVAPHDRQITQATGQQFGHAYLNGLLTDHAAWLDSEPPTAGVLAAEQVQGAGLDMLARLYEAHYVEGRRIADDAVLSDLAGELELDRGIFSQAMQSFRGEAVNAHFAESRDLLSAVGARGYPTFVIERDGRLERLDHTPFLGRPDAWQSALKTIKLSQPAPSQVEAGCGPNGCVI